MYLIVGNDQNVGRGDDELQNLLDDLEFDATVLDDQENSREAIDANLVIISESANGVQGEYRNEEYPVLVLNSNVLEDMRMIGQNDDVRVNAREVDLEDENNEIAEAVNLREGDRVQISQNNVQLGFAEPGLDAEVVLTQLNNRNRALLFTYQEGDEMDRDQEAPGTRVAFGIPENALADLDADGDDLLEAAILFAWSDGNDARTSPADNGRGRR